jgi:ankyrin repeat protein
MFVAKEHALARSSERTMVRVGVILQRAHDLRGVSGSRLLAAVLGFLALGSVWFGVNAVEAPAADKGALDTGQIDRRLDVLRKTPQDPSTLAFFREMPFDRVWPEVQKTNTDLQLRYLLLLRFLNDGNQEAVAELMRRKGDDVLRVAQETYWPLVVFPLREDGAYHWATLASQWDPGSRTLTNIVRLSIEKRYASGSLVHFKQSPQCAVTDTQAGGTSWSYRGDYQWDDIIAYHYAQWALRDDSRRSSNTLVLLSGASLPTSKENKAPLARRWRIAVMAAPAIRETGLHDLAWLQFQTATNIDTVERAEIDKIMRERETAAAFGGGQSGERLVLAKLLNADAIVFLSVESHAGRPLMKHAVCERHTGALLSLSFCPWPPSNRVEQAEEVAAATLSALKRFPNGVERLVCVTPFRCRNLTYEYDHLQTAYARLLQMGLTRIPGVAVIETEEALAIRREMELTGDDSLKRLKPLSVDGEFEFGRKGQGTGQRVSLSIKSTDGIKTLTSVERCDIGSGEVAGLLVSDVPRALLAGAAQPGAASGSDADIQFTTLVAQADQWERIGEWAKAVDLREAAVLIKSDAVEQRLSLIHRHTTQEARFGHLDFVVQRGLVDRTTAIALCPIVYHVPAVKPLLWFTTKLSQSMLAERERRIDFLTRTYPRVLSLQSATTNTASDVQAWRATLDDMTSTDASLRDDVVKRISIPTDIPAEVRFLATFELTNGCLGVCCESNAIPDRMRYMAYSRQPLPPSTLASLRESERDFDRFYAHYIDMAQTNQFVKEAFLHASVVLEFINQPKAAFALADQGQTVGVIRESATIVMNKAQNQLSQRPRVFGSLPLCYRPGEGPGQTDSGKTVVSFERVPFRVRRQNDDTVDLEGYKVWGAAAAHSRPAPYGVSHIINCDGAFDVFWSDKAVLVHRERGLLTECLTNAPDSFIDVVWDGTNIWVGTLYDGVKVLSPEGRLLRSIGEADGLPPVSKVIAYEGARGMLLYPLGKGKVFVAGFVARDTGTSAWGGRTWCAMVSLRGTGVAVNVFHEARRILTDRDTPDQQVMNPEMSFHPCWVVESQTGGPERILFVGRFFRTFWQARKFPLQVNLNALKVSVAASTPSYAGVPLPQPYELNRRLLSDLSGPQKSCTESALLGVIKWNHWEDHFYRVLLTDAQKVNMPSLYVAAANGDLDTVVLLTDTASDVDAGYYMSPLSWAAAFGHLKVVERLLEKGANANERNLLMKQYPLHCVVRPSAPARDQGEIIKALLKRGADVNVVDEQGLTPLHLALVRGHADAARLMLQVDVNPAVTDQWGRTVLHLACELGKEDIVDLLLRKKANVAASDKAGLTPLHVAAACGHVGVMKHLLGAGAGIEAKDKLGDTPLHKAVWMNCPSAVETLLSSGAAADAKDGGGQTPVHWAERRGFREIAGVLRHRGAK